MAATLSHRQPAKQALLSNLAAIVRHLTPPIFGVQAGRFRVYASFMKALTYIDGLWHEGNPPLLGSMTHATWQSSIVFDGARAFEGVTPDLDKHCERVVNSARNLGLAPMLSAGEIEELARDGVRQFSRDAELYIRPMFFAEEGFIVPL